MPNVQLRLASVKTNGSNRKNDKHIAIIDKAIAIKEILFFFAQSILLYISLPPVNTFPLHSYPALPNTGKAGRERQNRILFIDYFECSLVYIYFSTLYFFYVFKSTPPWSFRNSLKVS